MLLPVILQLSGSILFAQTDSSSKNFIINKIELTGNKVTKPHIVLREVTFKSGDTLSDKNLKAIFERSRQNLLNTSLFNFVVIDTVSVSQNILDVKISLVERWYTWPAPLFEIQERNFNVWWETKDLNRVNYGFYLVRENFRGRKESITLKLRLGYSEQYGIAYNIPFINKKQTAGMGFSFSYTRNREVPYNTLYNELLFFKTPGEFVRKDLFAKVNYTYRKGFYTTHGLEARFTSGKIADTVLKYNPDYFMNQQTQMEYLGVSYFFRRDLRDFKVYPLKGSILEFDITKTGLGLLQNEKLDITSLYVAYRKYWQLFNRVYFAGGLRGKVSSTGFQPYSVQRALGYRDYVRAYEYYVIDGQSFGLVKTSLKYELIKPQVRKLPWIKNEKFKTFHYALYIEGFGDAGYVEDHINSRTNFLNNTALYGTGIGLNLVTYYDNIFRFEYSWNKLGESAFFVHFSAPI